MQIILSKNSEVPLRQQLAEQIVLAITTGELRPGERLPSVRALARRVKIHHNTVSEAYQELVRRKWLTRQRGSRLIVGEHGGASGPPRTLDELFGDGIARAKAMGYSLQEVTERVRERLMAQPPDHVLVVEQEEGLRELIRRELKEKLGVSADGCTPAEFLSDPNRAVGAYVFAPQHIIGKLKARFAAPLTYSKIDEHNDQIRGLKKPSIIAAVSVSESLLRTARSAFAPAVARKHAFREVLMPARGRVDLRGVDLALCDSISIGRVSCRQKIQYELISSGCLRELAAAADTIRDARQG
jgi:DNA-binding transcriptional regulator YhcF (GntR family)